MAPIPKFFNSQLKKFLALAALVVVTSLASCKERDESSAALKYRPWSGIADEKIGLRFLYADSFNVCVVFEGNTTMPPAAKDVMTGLVRKSLEIWVAGLGDLHTGGINIKFLETCEATTHFKIHVDENVETTGTTGREYAREGEIFIKPMTSAATILHEVGHAFAGLDDLYLEEAGNCQPFQPNSVMCRHADPTLIDIRDDDKLGIQETYRIVYKNFWGIEAATTRAQSAVDLANSDLTGCKIALNADGLKPSPPTGFRLDLTAVPTLGGSAAQFIALQLDYRMSFAQMRDKILSFMPKDAPCRSKLPQYAMYESVLSKLNSSQNKCQLSLDGPILLPPSEDIADLEALVRVTPLGSGLKSYFKVTWFDGQTPEQIEQRTLWSLARPEHWKSWGVTQLDCFPGRDQTSLGLTVLKAGDVLKLDLKNSKAAVARYLSLKEGDTLSFVISPAPAPIRSFVFDLSLLDRNGRTDVKGRIRPEITQVFNDDQQTIVGPVEGIFVATPYDQSSKTDIRTIEFGNFIPVSGELTVMGGAFGNFKTFGGSAGDHVFQPSSARVVLDKPGKIAIEVAKGILPVDKLDVRLFGPLKKEMPLPLTRANLPEMQPADGSRYESKEILQPGIYQIEFFLGVPPTAPPGPSFLPFRLRVNKI